MSFRYCADAQDPLKASFQVYLHDSKAAHNQIQALSGQDARGVLMFLYGSAPHAVAKQLAIFWPWTADNADAAEAHVQESLFEAQT